MRQSQRSCGVRGAKEHAERKQRDMRREKKGCGEQNNGSRLHFRDRNSEAATIPLLGCCTPQVASQDMLMLMYFTHCRSGGRLCCVSHTPKGSWFLGMLYLSDHWEAFSRPQYFTSITTNWTCSSRSSATTYCTNTKCPQSSHILHHLIYVSFQCMSNTYLHMVTPVLLCHAFLKENRQWNTECEYYWWILSLRNLTFTSPSPHYGISARKPVLREPNMPSAAHVFRNWIFPSP